MATEWIAFLDPGSAHVRAAAARLGRKGRLVDLHLAQVPSVGIRRGLVTDPGAAGQSIRRVVGELAEHARVEIRSVQIAWRSRSGTNEAHLPRRRAYRGVLPREMVESGGHPGLAADPAMEKALAGAGLVASRWLDMAVAAAHGAAGSPESGRRFLCIDIGAGVADWALMESGRWIDAGVIALGGDHFTSDLAAFGNVSQSEAERFKHSLSSLASNAETFVLGERTFAVSDVRDVLEARAADLSEAIGNVLRERAAVESILLAGGSGALFGLAEFLSAELRIPVRRGAVSRSGPTGFPADAGWSAIAGTLSSTMDDHAVGAHDPDDWRQWIQAIWDDWWGK